jgi:hypothetical protein
MKFFIWLTAVICLTCISAMAAAPVVYTNNFQQEKIGSVPEGLLVLEGAFSVQEEGSNKFLELPGAPLETFGVLFGPPGKENRFVSARIFGTAKGRRGPTFGVGLSGAGGYKLQVAPSKKLIEFLKGDELKLAAPFDWKPGQWTRILLAVEQKGKGWTVTGKAPAAPMIAFEEREEPLSGMASIWGNPFAGTPIRFDDLSVGTIERK